VNTEESKHWIKSSYSNGSGPDCVEVMRIAGGFAVRDSKRRSAGVLRFSDREMAALRRQLEAWG
jgi:hypothetical protein